MRATQTRKYGPTQSDFLNARVTFTSHPNVTSNMGYKWNKKRQDRVIDFI